VAYLVVANWTKCR